MNGFVFRWSVFTVLALTQVGTWFDCSPFIPHSTAATPFCSISTTLVILFSCFVVLHHPRSPYPSTFHSFWASICQKETNGDQHFGPNLAFKFIVPMKSHLILRGLFLLELQVKIRSQSRWKRFVIDEKWIVQH